MRNVTFSSMVPGQFLEFEHFEANTMIHTTHEAMDWGTAWSQILQIALYQKGPDISEIGSTWLENLNSMHSLRPFNSREMQGLGGVEAFSPSSWQFADTSHPSGWISVPWTLDTRLLHFRRDLLAKAGIAEDAAFCTPEAFYDTLSRLRDAASMPYPLAMATGANLIHNVASWVWGRGGHFRSPDNRKISLTEPEARQGLLDYYRLHEFISPEIRGGNYNVADTFYNNGRAAVLYSGQWNLRVLENSNSVNPVVRETSKPALPPGIPYVGGSHLVIWRHSLNDSEAIELIHHLHSSSVLNRACQISGIFPAPLNVLNAPPFTTDPRYQVVVECIRKGRGFQSSRLWAGVEMRLTELMDRLWADLFADPQLDLSHEIEKRITEMARRLERTILAT